MFFFKTTFARLVLVFILGLLSVNAHSVYKWKDAEGNIQYTEYPPPTGEVEVLKPPPISTVGAQKSNQPAGKQENNKDETRPKEGEQQKVPADLKAIQAMKEKNCEIAKKNLATYIRTKKIRDKDGNVTRLADDDWQRRVDKTRESIKEYCK